MQVENKIIITGNFSTIGSYGVPKIGRLNYDGTLDFSFYISSSPIEQITSVKVISNGKILIGGYFLNPRKPFLYRLNSFGTMETSFSDNQIIGNDIYDINVQSNGNIYIGGDFTSFGTDGRNRFARLTESFLGIDDFNITQELKIYPNPTANLLSIDVKEDCEIKAIQIFNVIGQKVINFPITLHQKTIDVSNLKSGTYFIKMETNYGTLNKSFIKN
jgi:hypothetical protein